MTTVWRHAVFSVLACAGALALQPAVAQANCDWYVKTSLTQQQRNMTKKCGFTGREWSTDKATHQNFCANVGPDASRKTAQKREKALKECGG
jgi:membrane protease subunit (stomatin/prohibitin family)